MISNLDTHYNPGLECVKLIERHYARAMKTGGGPLPLQRGDGTYATPQRIAPEKKAKALELAAGGKHSATEIARMVGATQSTVAKLLYREGISVKDGRGSGSLRTVVALTHNASASA